MSELTTSELLATLHKSGMDVSHDQLKYWRRNDLLPEPVIRGKGRGMGVEQFWDKVCVENVRLILDSNKGKRINLLNAGRYLFARNKPIGESLLRRYLLELALELQEAEKQREKLADDNPVLIELIRFLTPEKVREAITKTEVNQMLKLYDSINKFDTPLGAQVAWISNCHPVFDVLVETEFPDLTGKTSLSNEALHRRQRSTLAWIVLIHYSGDSLYKLAQSAIQQLISKSMSSLFIQPIVWPKTLEE
ncbi:hypothetical protein C8R34_14811 [Nitrosomonas sp. Nm84]|uniref:hypothetical protein n=1 Tax=Nitrosomonas sp. Nm84 TaxID=200124 RepID=UPI000D7701FA|nr:hypothetical protein [Nitrosomonas sp. Nm84]PXW80429.1 hypothetical protein C8R34_14811 [Nitrosomonas sp. Nm84]